jgi:hypothetical protein
MVERLGFEPTEEQARLILTWYALDDLGHFPYRRAIVEMPKGWGKSPLAASIALAEFVGPVVFDGWDADGRPVGRPREEPVIQIAAVSEDQTDNTYGAIYSTLSAGTVADDLGIDIGRTRLYIKGQPSAVLEPVTASAPSREGAPLNISILDETHLWTPTNGGIKLAATLQRNAAKMGGRTFETTNAPLLGVRSVAERSGLAVERGHAGILHYAKRPPVQPEPEWSDPELVVALNAVYGDAHWIDIGRLVKEIRDPSTAWDDALRFYFNTRTAGTGRAVDPRRWAELAAPQDVEAKTEIGLGFDGSVTQDETWLVGCTRAGYAFVIGRWNRPPDSPDWRVPRADVQARIEWAFSYYRVGRFLFDPPKWETEGEGWQTRWNTKAHELVMPLDTNQPRRQAPAVDRLLVAIREGSIHHDGDPDLADHVAASHLKKVHINAPEDDGRTRYVIVKGEDRRKIDGAMALLLAYEAAMSMPELPEPVKPRFIDPFEED